MRFGIIRMFCNKNILAFIVISVFAVAVNAATPITILTDKSLNFGTAVKPTSGNVIVVVKKNGNLGAGTTAIMLNTSNLSEAQNTISGDKHDTIQISFDNCNSNNSMGLRLKDFDAKYGGTDFMDSEGGLKAPGNKTTLKYGATLVIRSVAQTGHLSPCYNINVDYD